MKKNRLGVCVLLLLLLTSCGGYYRMTSRINRDGSMFREVYATGDSAFLAGDSKRQPFLFRIDSDWELTKLNPAVLVDFWGEEHSMNVKVSRELSIVGSECFRTLEGKEFMRPFVVPKETLQKKFRWFFTYYTFEATYEELPDKGPVPLNRYMSTEEQQLWLRGERSAFEGWNGIEMKNALDDLDSKFWKWFTRNQYEISWQILHHFALLHQRDTTYLPCLTACKEDVFKIMSEKDEIESSGNLPESVCNTFDKLCKTEYYSQLYKSNKKTVDAMFQEKCQVADLAGNVMRYELSMPGQLLTTNAPTQIEGLLTWRVDVMRLLNGNYVLKAESRAPNYWAFGSTLLLILFGVWGFRKMQRK